jgi:adenylate cyclase
MGVEGVPRTGVYQFADYTVDVAKRELRRDGEPVVLQPKVFELIAHLIEHRDHVVDKQELQDALWPGVVVTETSLTQAIRKARRALGDDAELQGFIRTIHGHGYRFVAPMTVPPARGRTDTDQRSDRPTDIIPAHAADLAPRGATTAPTIVVLPFVNMSGDADQEYLADAITQDITTILSKHRWLRVVARNTAFGYKGKAVDVRDLARNLGVDYVVEGSVRRAGSRIRVTAELVDAAIADHKWAERYDGDVADVFDFQDEITGTIVARLEPEIGFAERQKVVRATHTDLQAWDCYHLGVAHFFKFTAEDNLEAQRLLQRSRELDPLFGEAHAWWAYATVLGMVYWDTEPSADILDAALDATQRALELDDQNAVFYALKARVQLARGEYDAARSENELAIALNPTLAAAHCGLADTLAYQGCYEDAISRFEMVIRMSPNDPQRWAFLTYGSLAFIFKRDFEAAVAWADRAAEIPNCQYWTLAHKAVALAYLDRLVEARQTVDKLLVARPGFCRAFARQKLFYLKQPEQLQMYLDGLSLAGVPDTSTEG